MDRETFLVVVETRPHPKIDLSTTVRRGASKYCNHRVFQFCQREEWTTRNLRGAFRDFDLPQHLTLFYHDLLDPVPAGGESSIDSMVESIHTLHGKLD